MNNRQAFRWKKKHLIPIVSILLLIAMCLGISWRTQGIVTRFDPADYMEGSTTAGFDSPLFSVPYDLVDIDRMERQSGLDSNGQLIPPQEGHTTMYGVAMVVKVRRHENFLMYYDEEGCATAISPLEVRKDTVAHQLYSLSHVKTQVEILEVLYQKEMTGYRAGERAELLEFYYILDRRVPSALKTYTDTRQSCMVRTQDWQPMEQDEIYIVFGHVNNYGSEKYQALDGMVIPYWTGIYCLSDLEKQAGYPKNAETLAANLAYLWQTYPEIMEKYADK